MKHVVITGGSRGIGAAAVKAFCARGDQVIFLYEKNTDAAQRTAEQTGARAVQIDLTDSKAVQDFFAGLDALDILVNNAGISVTGLMSQTEESDWLRLFDVNVHSIYRTVNAAMPLFLKKHSGVIINLSSMWGQVGASCEAGYSATKGAVIALSKALAKELGPSGIRVNAVAPGVIMTDMMRSASEETLNELRAESPLEMLGMPEDVAQAILYLADAPFVTGQVLGVNGGFVI